MSMVINLVEDHNIYLCEGGPVYISKDEACGYLNLSRSRFDDLVREGSIPRGRKRRWFKELVWYKDELQQIIK